MSDIVLAFSILGTSTFGGIKPTTLKGSRDSNNRPIDIVEWFKKYEGFASICGLSDDEKKIHLRAFIDGSALKNYEAKLTTTSYVDIKADSITKFQLLNFTDELRRHLSNRKMGLHESIDEYVSDIQH